MSDLADGEHPPMWDWYNRYYEATRTSTAYAEFCRRVFGANFAQHGFSDMAQVAALLAVMHLDANSEVLELGCGNGALAEYICDTTGARVTGIDYSPQAIRQAQERARSHSHRLAFHVMDMARLDFLPGSFNAIISIDSLYFTDVDETIGQMKAILRPGGQMGIFFAQGADPEHPIETFDRSTLPPDRTPLGRALARHGLAFTTQDFTQADYAHAQLKKQVMEELRPALEAEGNLFLYENRHGEAMGVMAAIEAGAHARYLYHARQQRNHR